MNDQDTAQELEKAKIDYAVDEGESGEDKNEKFPYSRQLTILETLKHPPSKLRGVGVTYVPIHLEPCVILQGAWLHEAGFEIGEHIIITVNKNELIIHLDNVE